MVKKAESADAGTAASAPATQGKEASQPRTGGIFRYIVVMAVAALIAIAVGSFAIHAYVVEAGARDHGRTLATLHARRYTAYIDQVLSQVARQVAGVTADKSLSDVLVLGDEATLRARADAIRATLASRAEVYLIPGSSLANLPPSYAAQEMVERARRGEQITGEVISAENRLLLLMAASIRDTSQTIVGTLLVAFEFDDIAGALRKFDAGNGEMILLQQVDTTSEPQVILRLGQEVASLEFESKQDTGNPNLTVAYRLDPQSAVPSTAGLFMLLTAAMALLVLVSVILASFFLQRSLRRNGSMLIEYAEALIQRAPMPVGITFTIDIFEHVAQSLRRAARATPAAEQLAVAPARAAAPRRTDDAEEAAPGATREAAPAVQIADEIFRAYDIRGVVGKTLTVETVRLIGQAIGSENLDNRQSAIHVGRDGRLSGPQLLDALIQGITSTGCNVIDVGMVPTPLVYFAAAHSAVKSGVMLTGSHNPPDYNGLKIVINGETLSDERIQALKRRILESGFHSGKGSVDKLDITGKYMERIKDDIVLARSLKIVVDCGNGVAGAIAPKLLEGLGCSVVPLYCEVDGNFPNHHPDPSKAENLKDLIARVASEGADLGLAFDGDGDRIGVVTPKGEIIWPDRLMMLYSRDLLMRTPGADIIYDVKCTRDLATVISQHGGRPIMWRTGHSLIKAKLKETGAALAGEMSGHIFFNDRWPGFDDGIYSAARLLEILSLEVAGVDEVFAEFPVNVSTPELHIKVTEDSKFRIVEALQKNAQFPGGSISTIDGVRVDYPNAWGLVRASNTTPVLVARFEGRTEQDMDTVRTAFREQLLRVEPSLRVDF